MIINHNFALLVCDRLQKIRSEIVASSSPLLTWEGVEQDKAERRGGDCEDSQGFAHLLTQAF